jgi:hypothetical protein
MADVQENVRLRKDPAVIFVEHRFFSFDKKHTLFNISCPIWTSAKTKQSKSAL